MKIGNSVSFFRSKNDLTQKELAKEVGIDQSYLSQIENNKKQPSTKLLEKICSVLNITLPILLVNSIEQSDVKDEKKELYNALYPTVKSMINQIFVD